MLRKLKIGQKIIIVFGLILLIFIGIGSFQIFSINHLGQIQDQSRKRAEDAIYVAGASGLGAKTYQVIADAIINRDMNETKLKWQKIKDENSEIFLKLKKNVNTPEETTAFDKSKAIYEDLIFNVENMLFPLIAKNNSKAEDLAKINSTFDYNIAEIHNNLNLVSESIQKENAAGFKEYDVLVSNMINSAVVVLTFIIVLLIGLSVYFNRNINNIVAVLIKEMKRLTNAALGGQLNERADVDKINFEFRGIAEGMNQTLDALIFPLNVAAEYVNKISIGDIPSQ